MSNILTVQGNIPKWPLMRCCGCSVQGCKLAVDKDNMAVFDDSDHYSTYLKWTDIQNRPGWNNGWPPGMGQSKGAVWKLVDFSDPVIDMTRKPISDDRAQKCDCGAAAADYNISRDGGPGHVDWCKVYNKGSK